jgi:hypothetical protein
VRTFVVFLKKKMEMTVTFWKRQKGLGTDNDALFPVECFWNNSSHEKHPDHKDGCPSRHQGNSIWLRSTPEMRRKSFAVGMWFTFSLLLLVEWVTKTPTRLIATNYSTPLIHT